jgi:PAS domain S-box-containing protein
VCENLLNFPFMGRSISRNLTLSLSLLVCTVVSSVVMFVYFKHSRDERLEEEKKANEYINGLSEILALPMRTSDGDRIRQIASIYAQDEHIEGIRIMDSRGGRMFEFSRKGTGIPVIGRTKDISFGGRTVGRAEISLSLKNYQRHEHLLLNTSLFTLVLALAVITCATGLLLCRFLKKPLKELQQGMERVAEGDLSSDFQGIRYRELAGIAERFDEMASKVRAREKAMENMNRMLQHEIEERRLADEALHFKNTILLTQQETSPDGVMVVSDDGQVISFNRRYQEMWGIPDDVLKSGSEECVMESVMKGLVAPEVFLTYVRHLHVHRNEKSCEEFSLKDGRTLEYYTSPMFGPDGTYLGRVCFCRDITGRKRREEELQRARRAWEDIFQAIGHPALILDPLHRIIAANRAAIQATGLRESEIIGSRCYEIFHRGAGTPAGCPMEKLLQFGNTKTVEMEMEAPAGISLISCTPVFDEQGNLEKIIHIAADITDRRLAEEELARHRDRLEEIVNERTRELKAAQEELLKRERLAVLGQLTAAVSHELRNPLGVIRSSAFYLQRKFSNADEKTTKHLMRIDEQVTVCDSIIANFLEYTRGSRPKTEEGDVNAWLRQILDRFDEEHGFNVVRKFSPDLPAVPFDAEKLRLVMLNLLENAAQAATSRLESEGEAGAYHPCIQVGTMWGKGGVIIEVEDNGIGMDENTTRHAFDPLFTTRARGTGLGLSIVQKVIGEHGGSVSLESVPFRGTKVTVELPIK